MRLPYVSLPRLRIIDLPNAGRLQEGDSVAEVRAEAKEQFKEAVTAVAEST